MSLLLLLAACSSGGTGSDASTGVRLVASWDSSLEPVLLRVWMRRANGPLEGPREMPIGRTIAPPGVREARVDLDVPISAASEARLLVKIEGLSSDGAVTGIGSAETSVVFGRTSEMMVRLFSPSSATCVPGSAPCGPETPSRDAGVDPPPSNEPSFLMTERLAEARTESAEFVDIPDASLTLSPSSSGGRWMFFVSGLMRSSTEDEIAAELRVLVNGREVDGFGHQTHGGVDSWAGFISFDLIEDATAPQIITPQFRAATGTTFVSSLRVVAARLPSNADVAFSETDGIEARSGAGLVLDALELTPRAPGAYAVFARVSQREGPSSATVRSWLELPSEEIRPIDSEGARFSNARDAWQPMFTATRVQADGSPMRIRLRGDSSAGLASTPWWNQAFRLRRALVLPVQPGSLASDMALPVTFDHLSMTADGNARLDGADVRIVARTSDGAWLELPRSVDPIRGFGRVDTTLWVRPSAGPLPIDGRASFFLFYGHPESQDAPVDPFDVTPLTLTVGVGAEESSAGQSTSQWKHARILAFRMDAFREAFYAEDHGSTKTRSPSPSSKTMLVTSRPERRALELAIQSMRISGEATDAGRRSGLLGADGAYVLETSLRIDRDGSASGGYHHNAAVARVIESDRAIAYENAVRSPDGIEVSAADSVIMVLR